MKILILFIQTIMLISCVGNINELGSVAKIRYYGGIQKQKAVDIISYNDRKYILGTSNSFDSNSDDVYLICTDQEGNELFSRVYGQQSVNEIAVSFVHVNDGLLIAYNTSVGEGQQNRYRLLRINFNGDVLNEGRLSDINYLATSLLKINENEFIINGEHLINNQKRYFISKINSLGDKIWITEGAETFSNNEIIKGHILPGESKSIFFGNSNINETNQKNQVVLAIVVDNDSGAVIDNKTYGGVGNDEFFDFTYKNREYHIIGTTTSDFVKSTVKSSKDFLYFKVSIIGNKLGDSEHKISFGGEGNDIGKSIVIDNNNDIILYGQTQSFRAGVTHFDQIIIKLNSNGVVKQDWINKPRLIGADRNDVAVKVLKDSNVGIYYLGEVTFTTTDDNILISLFKTSANSNINF